MSPHFSQAVPLRLLSQQFQTHPPVVVDEEHILKVVAPLCDMMGTTNRDCSC